MKRALGTLRMWWVGFECLPHLDRIRVQHTLIEQAGAVAQYHNLKLGINPLRTIIKLLVCTLKIVKHTPFNQKVDNLIRDYTEVTYESVMDLLKNLYTAAGMRITQGHVEVVAYIQCCKVQIL